MRIKIYFITLLIISLLIISCDNDVVDPNNDKGIVFITSTPDAAAIWIDGTDTKKLTPAKLEVSVGKHIITLRKPQYASKSITIDVRSDQENIVNIDKLVMLGGVRIFSIPKFASIFINGVDKETSTPDEFSLLEGQYKITLKMDEFFDTTYIVNIRNAVTVVDTIKLRSKNIVSFTGIIWDSTSTELNKLAGLDLSTGENVKFKNGINKNADLYYSAKNNLIGSPRKINFENNETMIRKGGKDYRDRVDAPTEMDEFWSDSTYVSSENYFFLYDGFGHYSKLQVVGYVGGTAQDTLKGIKVKWLYNKKAYDNFF